MPAFSADVPLLPKKSPTAPEISAATKDGGGNTF